MMEQRCLFPCQVDSTRVRKRKKKKKEKRDGPAQLKVCIHGTGTRYPLYYASGGVSTGKQSKR